MFMANKNFPHGQSPLRSTPSPPLPLISHVIFDFDGILVDTERLYTDANRRTLAMFGKEFTIEFKSKMMGKKKADAVKTLLSMSGLDGRVGLEQYMLEYDKQIESLMRETKALPGADRLLRHLFKIGIPLGICTGSDQVEFRHKTANVSDWLKMVPESACLLCGSDPDVKEGKPSPEPYHVLISRLAGIYPNAMSPKPENVLVFEDSMNGVKSAVQAGCTVIMVPQPDQLPGDWREHLPSEANLVAILDSLEDFKPEHYGLGTIASFSPS